MRKCRGTGEGRGERVIEEAVEALALPVPRRGHPPRSQAYRVHPWGFLLYCVAGFDLYAVADLLDLDPHLGMRADLEKLSRQLERRLIAFGPQALTARYSSVQADISLTPLVFITYPVDDFDPCLTVTNYQYRFCAIPSFVDLVGAPYRVVLVSGPSCIMPLACCGVLRRVSFLIDGVNAHVTLVIAAIQFLRDHCR
jgi:hypothetical protein